MEKVVLAKSPAEKVKFKLEFMALMLMSGRVEEAEEALAGAHEILAEMIEEGK